MLTARPKHVLTRREWLCWCCYIGGMSHQQIADSLGLTRQTASSYLKDARKKTGARDAISASRIRVEHV